THAQFLGAAATLARALPDARHAVNLCEDRAQFMLAFAAICIRGQANLLPPGRQPGVVAEIARGYPGAYLVCDGAFEDIGLPRHDLAPFGNGVPWDGPVPQVPASHAAAIVFTSGSTGGPQPHVKSWRNLVATADLC